MEPKQTPAGAGARAVEMFPQQQQQQQELGMNVSAVPTAGCDRPDAALAGHPDTLAAALDNSLLPDMVVNSERTCLYTAAVSCFGHGGGGGGGVADAVQKL